MSMPSIAASRSLVLGVVTLTLLLAALLLTRLDLAAIGAAAKQLALIPVMLSLALMVAGALLAVVRLRFIATDIGTPLSFGDAMLALSIGQIVGAVSVQFFGQIAARSALLGRRGISSSANIVIATYERAAAVFVSAALAVGGAVYLFGHVTFDIEKGGAQFITIVAGLICVVFAGAVAVWGQFASPFMRALATPKVVRALIRNALVTLAIQLCTAGAYLSIGSNLAGDIPAPNLLAASFVVMFAASLPISFSGWGMREISAVFVLGSIGVGAATALLMAVAIGTLALAAVILIAGAAVTAKGVVKFTSPPPPATSLNVTAITSWTLPIAAATAVFFQIYVPVGDAPLSVNLADPIAILGGALFLIEYGRRAQWRLPALPIFAALMAGVILLSYAHGYLAFGSNHWASFNRVLGSVIIAGYFLGGALIVAHADERGMALLAKTMAVTACTVVLFWSALIFVDRLGLKFPEGVLVSPLSGFSQNRNAFSFALLAVICTLPFIERSHRRYILAILLFGLWLATSYAALGTFVVILAALMFLRVLSWQEALHAMLMAALALIVFQFLPGQFALINITMREMSNAERMVSMKGGIEMFLQHPIFGAGLGAFMEANTIAGRPLVVHSTPIWILAEMGLIGLLAFVAPAIWLFCRESRRIQSDPTSQGIVLLLMMFGAMSQVHEMLYQRIFWLVLGALLAMRMMPLAKAK